MLKKTGVFFCSKSVIIPIMKKVRQPHVYTAVLNTPVGRIGILSGDGKLRGIDFLTGSSPEKEAEDPLARQVLDQLSAYFNDPRRPFALPLELEGTEFQRAVWKQLCRIKPGTVRTYGDIARVLHSSPRAVGNACRANPVPIIVPCHRVVSSQGIGGYGGKRSGTRLEKKRRLLSHEGVLL